MRPLKLKISKVNLSREVWARVWRSFLPWAVEIDEEGHVTRCADCQDEAAAGEILEEARRARQAILDKIAEDEAAEVKRLKDEARKKRKPKRLFWGG